MKKKIAYKGFNLNDKNELVCRDMVFKVGEIAEVKGELKLCANGIHFCWNLNDINDYYNLRESVICEVEILGDIVNQSDLKKSCTNKLRVIRVLTKEQVWALSNTGSDNTGYINSGDGNSGDRNSGDRNSGNWNSGNWNSGDGNSGNWNSGNWNSGNRNSGNWNSGNWNSGDGNSGDGNSGNWNSGNGNSGFFNTIETKCFIFDKLSDMTVKEFFNSEFYKALVSAPFILTEWVYYTDEEKQNDKAKELIEGYLKHYDYKEACSKWWNAMSNGNKAIVRKIPNFDADKFYEITGIRL